MLTGVSQGRGMLRAIAHGETCRGERVQAQAVRQVLVRLLVAGQVQRRQE
jgi:hypothetical protein